MHIIAKLLFETELLKVRFLCYTQKQPKEVLCNLFLEILQNSKENNCARDSVWIKLLALGLQLY